MTEISNLNKVCLIVNYNLYESKRHFSAKLAEALERKGIQTRLIDIKEAVMGAEIISQILKFRPDLTCSFNSLLPISEKQFLWDYLQTPHWSIVVDPVIYSMNLIDSPYSIISSVDRNDYEAIKSYPFHNVFFWPHAVEKELTGRGEKDKSYDVVFLGTCYDYESLRASWRQQNPEQINKALDDAIDLVLADNHTSTAQALVQAMNAANIPPQGLDFQSFYYYIDYYTRGKDRVELIKSIKDAKVHIFGELSRDTAVGVLGWEQYLAKCPNVTLHPSVTFQEGLDILKRSKIALNSMPFFKNGTHERVFTALGNGALPITSDNVYWRSHFRDGEELVLYSSANIREVNDMVNIYLADDQLRNRIVEQGAAKVLKEHTWDVRVEQLLQELPAMLAHVYSMTSSPE